MGRDVVVDKHRVLLIKRSDPGKIATLVENGARCACFVGGLLEVLVLCDTGAILLNVRKPDRPTRLRIDGDCDCAMAHVGFHSHKRSGFVVDKRTIFRCELKSGTLHILAPYCRLDADITSIACDSSDSVLASTLSGLYRVAGGQAVQIWTGPVWSVTTAQGIAFSTPAGVFRFQDGIGSQEAECVLRQHLVYPAPLASFQRTLAVGVGCSVLLITSTEPLIRYLAQVRSLYIAGGFMSGQLGRDCDLPETIARVREVSEYVHEQYAEQKSAAVGFEKPRSLQGPGGLFPMSLESRLRVLLEGLVRLKQHTGDIHVVSRTLQEDVVESVFSLILRNTDTALTQQEFGVRFPKVGQLMLLRLQRGGKPLFTFANHHRQYADANFGKTQRIDVELDMPKKEDLSDRTASRKLFGRLRKAIGQRIPISRIRAQRRAPLGTKPAIFYLHPRGGVRQDDTQLTGADDDVTLTTLFDQNTYVAVVGAGRQIWIARLTAAVTSTQLDEEQPVPVVWLERRRMGWVRGQADLIAPTSLICSVDAFVTTDPLTVDDTAFDIARSKLPEESRPLRSEAPDSFGPEYRTTRGDRAARHALRS